MQTRKGWSEVPSAGASRIFTKTVAGRSLVVVISKGEPLLRAPAEAGDVLNSAKSQALAQVGLTNWTVSTRRQRKSSRGHMILSQQGSYTSTDGKRTLFAEEIVALRDRTLRLLMTARAEKKAELRPFTELELKDLEEFIEGGSR